MQKKIAFCFAFTPLQAKLLSDISDYDYDIIYLFNTSKNHINLGVPAKNIRVIFNGNTGISKGLKLLSFFLKFRYLLSIPKDIYVAHPHHEYVNGFFFSENTNKIFLIEDGAANYIDPVLPASFRQRIVKRLSYLKLFGFSNYKFCEDYFCAQRVAKVFAYNPELLTNNLIEKAQPIKLSYNDSGKKRTNRALFLDQNIENEFSQKERDEIYTDLLNVLSDYEVTYYKGHHGGNVFKDKLLHNTSGIKVIDLEVKSTAEEVYEELQPSLVVSFYSTALINIIKMDKNANVLGYSPMRKKFMRNGEEISLVDLFRLFGVTIKSV